MKRLIILVLLLPTISFSADASKTSKIALKGGVANVSMTFLGPITSIKAKFAFGGEYWFSEHVALGLDLGLGNEGYGKVIGTTAHSIVDLQTGSFILDPGVSGTFALTPINWFTPYGGARLGFPLYSGYGGAISLGLTIGGLLALNDWAALDLALSGAATLNFQGNYLATVFSLGSIGFRVFL